MAIPMLDEEEINEKVEVSNNPYKTVVQYNDTSEFDRILQYLSGYKWTVDYFLQAKELDDSPEVPDPSLPDTLLQYIKINDLILFVQQPIDQAPSKEVTGTAIINGGFVPLKGDIFKTVLTGNKNVLFYITNVTKNNYNNKKVYEVEYKVFSYLDSDTKVYSDIITKVIKEYYYNKNFVLENVNPMLNSDDFNNVKYLEKKLIEITKHYLNEVIDNKYNLFLVPNSYYLIADLYFENFIFKVFSLFPNTDFILGMKTRLSIDDKCFRVRTILDNLLEKNNNLDRYFIKQKVGITNTIRFNSHPLIRSLIYQGVDDVIIPVDCKFDVSFAKEPLLDDLEKLVEDEENELNDVKVIPEIACKNNKMYYIFSESFYLNKPVTLFESLVLDYLNNRVINLNDVKVVLETYYRWNKIQKYYFTPILILLIKDSIKNSFTTF